MKRLVPLLAILLVGCDWTVTSRDPFYTDQVRQSAPQLRGEWIVGDIVWIFTGDQTMSLRSYEEKGFRDIAVVPFAVAGRTFIDIVQDSNHVAYAVELTGTHLNLVPLSGNWLTNAIAQGQVQLPAPQRDARSNLVFTATSTQWVNFLSANATNNAIYGDPIELTKSPNANFIPARRQQPR